MSPNDVANWGPLVAIILGGATFWRDMRKQNIAGSLPTEYTKTLQERVGDLETRVDEKDNIIDRMLRERDEYARKTRNWFYATIQATAKGDPLPTPPPDWP